VGKVGRRERGRGELGKRKRGIFLNKPILLLSREMRKYILLQGEKGKIKESVGSIYRKD